MVETVRQRGRGGRRRSCRGRGGLVAMADWTTLVVHVLVQDVTGWGMGQSRGTLVVPEGYTTASAYRAAA